MVAAYGDGEPVLGPLGHGEYEDLDREAWRLSKLVHAEEERRAISARRAEAIADAEAAQAKRYK